MIPVFVSTKSVQTFRWGAPRASHALLPCPAIISFMILKAKTSDLEFEQVLGELLLVVQGYDRY